MNCICRIVSCLSRKTQATGTHNTHVQTVSSFVASCLRRWGLRLFTALSRFHFHSISPISLPSEFATLYLLILYLTGLGARVVPPLSVTSSDTVVLSRRSHARRRGFLKSRRGSQNHVNMVTPGCPYLRVCIFL